MRKRSFNMYALYYNIKTKQKIKKRKEKQKIAETLWHNVATCFNISYCLCFSRWKEERSNNIIVNETVIESMCRKWQSYI